MRSATPRRRVLTDAASYANPTGRTATVRYLELRRHAQRDHEEDKLSAKGRTQARTLGEASEPFRYAVVFVSPAQRAAETAAWFLRGAGHGLPEHEIVPALGGREAGGTAEGLAESFRSLLEQLRDGERAIAFSHTPLIEHGVFGLVGREIEPLGECEGVLLTLDDGGSVAMEELRLGAAG
jgi:phosphohistidine phosphatase SixA